MQYLVTFGDERSLPSCTCFDWRKYLIPCKHMLAVIKLRNEFTFDSLGSKYLDSPFFTIDYKEIGIPAFPSVSDKNITEDVVFPEICSIDNAAPCKDDGTFDNLPTAKYPKKTAANKCREMLKEITSFTYSVHDEETLNVLARELSDVLQLISSKAEVDYGLVIEQPKSTLRTNSTKVCLLFT